jgi:leucyl-tRNA synthetase
MFLYPSGNLPMGHVHNYSITDVVANEQVDSEGKFWRSGTIVEKKLLRQWFLKITDYAEELLQDLDKLPGWPERVRTMQAKHPYRAQGMKLSAQDNHILIENSTIRDRDAETFCGASRNLDQLSKLTADHLEKPPAAT